MTTSLTITTDDGVISAEPDDTFRDTLATYGAKWTWDDSGSHVQRETIQVAGDILFTVDMARRFRDSALESETIYPDDVIEAARDNVTEEFERILRWGLGQRRELLMATGVDREEAYFPTLALAEVQSIQTGWPGVREWDDVDTDAIYVEPEGIVVWGSGHWDRRTRALCVHGRDIPSPLRRASLVVLRESVVPTDAVSNALSVTNDLGTFRVSAAGQRGAWFGLPEADAVLDRWAANIGTP